MASPPEIPPKRATTVKFARKTSSGRYVSLSREDLDSKNYTVQMPPTPDNQPMDDEESSVMHEPLYGGIPRPQIITKSVDKSSACGMPECDQIVMQDTHGYDIYPCDCRFKICQSCYLDARKEAGTCPGCKEPYKRDEYDNENTNVSADSIAKTAAWVENNRVSMMMKRSETIDSDQSWLFEVQQGSYGYDSAFWPKEGAENVRNGIDEELEDGIPRTSNKPWKPLTRKIPMSAAIISPYRILILIRLVALIFFLAWRVKHPNEDAIWLWGMSVVCEIWFAISWILDQIPKLTPVNRSTDLSALQEKFETPSPTNEAKLSDLPGVDVFVSTADPDKEPPLVTANTILSILSADYPVEKLSCYISDDGGALLTFEAMAEAASFAATWVPFCRKHDIEPRNPESYFGLKKDPTKNKMRSDFVKDRRKVKRDYDEFKVRVNRLPDSIRRRSDAFNAREEMKILRKIKESGGGFEAIKAWKATWMADGTYWPGTWIVPGPDHSRGDHASILQVRRFEDKTEWGDRVGWIYGSVTEDVVTGYRMHNRGWRSIYCVTKRDAFRGSAPINLTDRLHQVLRWATGSVEIFFSRNNALFASKNMELLQRIAYLNVGIYPFTSIFLLVYCFLPALSLFSDQFIVQTLSVTFLVYLLTITLTLVLLAVLEVKWSGVGLEEWWRNEQFWLISGTSAHLYAVVQGLLKVVAGIEISFTLTSKSAASDDDDADAFADLYAVKWTSLMVPPITIMMVNLIAVAVGFARTVYSGVPQWSKLMGGGFFSFWVLVHLYPFAKGLMGRRGKTPTVVFVWSGLMAITISLLWVAINPPSGNKGADLVQP